MAPDQRIAAGKMRPPTHKTHRVGQDNRIEEPITISCLPPTESRSSRVVKAKSQQEDPTTTLKLLNEKGSLSLLPLG